MTSSGRLWVLAVLGILIAVVGVDWLQAQARLATIVIEGQLDPPQVIANGKDTIVLTVHVTENGQPRVNTLLQAWLESCSSALWLPAEGLPMLTMGCR